MTKTYLSAAETAKLVRAALKKSFPKTAFSVRSSTYSMGASITVKWTDGPAASMVEPITSAYSGSSFDAMIDMKTSHSSWLMPDGSAIVATNNGTLGSKGTISPERNWMPDPEAKLVSFGADYVFCTRKIYAALMGRAVARLAAKGYPVEVVEVGTNSYDGSATLKILNYSREASRGFDMERAVLDAAYKTHCVA